MIATSSTGPGPPNERPLDPGGDSVEQTSDKAHPTDETPKTKPKNTDGPEETHKDVQDGSGEDEYHGDSPAKSDDVAPEGRITPRVEGWDPAVTNRIKRTMAKTWSTPLGHVLTGDLKRLFAVATAVYPLHDDAHLREMTADEQQAFSAYMKGDLDLPAPPTFLTCTTTTLKRAGMLAYHQRHIEVTLIANVGSNLQVGKYLKKKSILRELHTANGGTVQGSLMMKRLMTDALRITFDGLNTMSFVFPSKRISKPWEGAALKFRAGALVLAGANATQVGIKPPPQLAQHYAINVVGVAGLDPIMILTVFNSITANHVMDIRQRGLDGLNEVDNDYWTVIFTDLDCPSMLRGVTCIIAKDVEMTIHHFKREPFAPCMRCLNPKHHHSRCKVSPQMLLNVRANRQRKFTGEIMDSVQFTPSEYVNPEFMNEALERFQNQDCEMSTEPKSNIPLEMVTIAAAPETTEAAGPVKLPKAVTRMVSTPDDDGYRVQRRVKKPTKHFSTTVEATQQLQSLKSTDINHAHIPDQCTERQHVTFSKTTRAKVKNKKIKFKTFAQLAASERYQQTRAAYALLDTDEGNSDDDTGDEQNEALAHTLVDVAMDSPSMQISQAEFTEMGVNQNDDSGTVLIREENGEHTPEVESVSVTNIIDAGAVQKENAELAPILEQTSDGDSTDVCVTTMLKEWMTTYGGHQVSVSDHGQTLYSAYFAATSNPSTDHLILDSDDVAILNVIKKNVLNVVLAKLRYDIQLELIQPEKELLRMYPATKVPDSTAGASAKLYAHFAADRFVSTSSHISKRTRVPVLELRAMAVYSREPIYVWTIGTNGVTRVDQYTTHSYEMQNGDIHETGIVVKLSPDAACNLLKECAHAHVAPIMMMQTEETSTFNGISLSSTFTQWDIQAGPTMRNRLDDVHTTLGFAHIDGAPIQFSSLREDAATEEQSILEELGVDVYASGAHNHSVTDPYQTQSKRTPVPSSTQVHLEIYSRILAEASPKRLSAIDSRKAASLHRANNKAFKKWMEKNGTRYGLLRRKSGYEDSESWPVENGKAMRHLTAHLPFPELAVQRLSTERLLLWGEQEACHHIKLNLMRIKDDEDQVNSARKLCKMWIEDIENAPSNTSMDIAQSETRWDELRSIVDDALIHRCPSDVPLTHWYILHVLPYVIQQWTHTLLARMEESARYIWYVTYPEIRKLCKDVNTRRDWSAITHLYLATAQAATLPATTQEELEAKPPATRK